MTFSDQRRRRGRIQGMLLDWASTTMDDGCMPPAVVGLNAGMWTIGLAVSGNEIGLPLREVQGRGPPELERRRQRAYTRLSQAGAHYVVGSLAEVLPCLDDIEARIARGERP